MNNPTSQILRVELSHRVDLNYRIDLPNQSVRTLLAWPGPAEVNLVELRKYDQVCPGSGQGVLCGAKNGAAAAKFCARA